MFTTLPRLLDSHAQSQFYCPSISSPLSSSPLRNSPSPLSDRDSNALPRAGDTMMSSPSKPSRANTNTNTASFIFDENMITPESWYKSSGSGGNGNMKGNPGTLPSPPPTRRETNFSRRTTKVNPLVHGRGDADEGRETRRKLFLRGVREKSEEKRWNDRGGDDEMMRCIWVAEQRRLDERRRREAMGSTDEIEEPEDFTNAIESDMEESDNLDAIVEALENPRDGYQDLRADDRLVNELHDWMVDSISPATAVQYQHQDTPYGSDDDEYDDIFMDVIQQENQLSSQPQSTTPAYSEDQDMMDMS